MPDHFLCYSVAPYSSCRAHAPEQFALRELRRRKPFIKELLHPIRDWDCPNVANFSNKIYDRPTIVPTLKVIETEVGEFSPSKTTPKKDGNNRTVSLAFKRLGIGTLPQRTRFIHGQPISKPDTECLDTLNTTDSSSKFRAEQTGLGGLASQSSNCGKPHVDCTRRQMAGFQVNSVAQHDSAIERKSRL
jgi:hypothetical protein